METTITFTTEERWRIETAIEEYIYMLDRRFENDKHYKLNPDLHPKQNYIELLKKFKDIPF